MAGYDTNVAENERGGSINISTSGDNTIIAAPTTAGNYLAIDFISFLPTTAAAVTFKSGSTSLTGAMPLDAKQALTWENTGHNVKGVIWCAPNESFVINLDGNVQTSGRINYREVGN